MRLTPGTRLGPCEVTASLGAGGMDDHSQATSGRQLHVVLSWFEELKAKVGR